MRFLRLSLILASAALFSSGSPAPAQDAPPLTELVLEADPAGTVVIIRAGDQAVTRQAPHRLELAPGTYELEFSAERHETLVTEISVEPGRPLRVRALLIQSPPERPLPEDLGLAYLPFLPSRLDQEAEAVRERYYSAAELFAIMPLAQAGLTLSISGETQNLEYWVGAGVVLTVTSAILGRRSYEKHREEVRLANQEIAELNRTATAHNTDIDRQIDAVYAAAVEQWQLESAGRGQVQQHDLAPETGQSRIPLGPMAPAGVEDPFPGSGNRGGGR